jgi:hypothetical protein
MRSANSAKEFIFLGATLIAIASPASAEIDGSGAQGITSADALGITSADAQGITSADALGITSADALGITSADALGITSADVFGIAIADLQLLSGPVDHINTINGVFESMGQVVMASQAMLSGMRVGDYVSVSGSVVSPGWLYADDVSVSAEPYVPGATEVVVSGMLSSVDLEKGTARMGGLTIDYTPSLGNADAPSGVAWSFRGIRPVNQGVMMSDHSGAIK